MVPKCSVNLLFFEKNTEKKEKLILRRPPINAFFFKIRCILVILDPKICPFLFFESFIILYKVCTIFWYQVYPNQIKTKETMYFFSFFTFSHKDLLFLQKEKYHIKKTRIVTETLFFIRFG